MSELQISLIVLGVVIILGVVAYNWWQDRRISKKMNKQMPVVEDDALLGQSAQSLSRREPGLGHLGLQQDSGQGGRTDDLDQDSQPSQTDLHLVEPDPVIEEVIELVFSAPKTGEQLLGVLHGVQSLGRKPVRLFVQSSDGVLNTRIDPEQHYMGLHLAVLLANRAGPISAIEWSQVWANASALAEEFEARVEGRDHTEVLAKAVQLDSTCATLDMQVGLNLLLEGPRDADDLVNCAIGMGFVENKGELAWVGEHGLSCFALARFDGHPFESGSQIDKLSLLLDVPRSPASETSFGRMMEVGAELARRVGATMVDDQGRPLAPGAENSIDERLQELYGQLEAAGLEAGSERARKVFA